MSGKRIVEETVCEHGNISCYSGTEVCPGCLCPGGSSRVLDPRLYRTDAWTKRTVDRINALALEGVDALSDHTEGTP